METTGKLMQIRSQTWDSFIEQRHANVLNLEMVDEIVLVASFFFQRTYRILILSNEL